MTLREIFNSVLDHPIEFELHEETALIALIVWTAVFGFCWWWWFHR